jgi:biotin carboxyl carrier protein
MSRLKGKVGEFTLHWLKSVSGSTGSAEVKVNGKAETVSWKKDSQGLFIEFSHGVFGYDFAGEFDEGEGRMLYRVKERNGESLFENQKWLNETELLTASSGTTKKKTIKIKSQMPGKIVKILVKPGEEVKKDQPVLVMEAMKMENEIRALAPGKIDAILVQEGQAVETGAELVRLV